MRFSLILPLFIVLSLIVNTVGFRRLVHFVSVGYALSVIVMSLVTGMVFLVQLPPLPPLAFLHLAGLIVWGARLAIYVLRREAKAAYQNRAADMFGQYNGVSALIKLVIWVSVSILYVLMFLPALFNATNTLQMPAFVATVAQALGLVVLFGGLAIEAVADRQKSVHKAQHPGQYCAVGLYRWVRCPNYLGEILFWLGGWIMGLPFYTTPLEWLGSLAGLLCIILIMIGSTKRLERSQDARYMSLPEFQLYVRTVPVLIPFVPIYSLKNMRVSLG